MGEQEDKKKDNYYTCSGKRYKNWTVQQGKFNIDERF
jgi:hypothetical protein